MAMGLCARTEFAAKKGNVLIVPYLNLCCSKEVMERKVRLLHESPTSPDL